MSCNLQDHPDLADDKETLAKKIYLSSSTKHTHDNLLIADEVLGGYQYADPAEERNYKVKTSYALNGAGTGWVLCIPFGPIGIILGALLGALIGFLVALIHIDITSRQRVSEAVEHKQKAKNTIRWAHFHFTNSDNNLQLVFKVIQECEFISQAVEWSPATLETAKELNIFVRRNDVQRCLWLYLDFFFLHWKTSTRAEIAFCQTVCEVCVKADEIDRKHVPVVERMKRLLDSRVVTAIFEAASLVKDKNAEKARKDAELLIEADVTLSREEKAPREIEDIVETEENEEEHEETEDYTETFIPPVAVAGISAHTTATHTIPVTSQTLTTNTVTPASTSTPVPTNTNITSQPVSGFGLAVLGASPAGAVIPPTDFTVEPTQPVASVTPPPLAGPTGSVAGVVGVIGATNTNTQKEEMTLKEKEMFQQPLKPVDVHVAIPVPVVPKVEKKTFT